MQKADLVLKNISFDSVEETSTALNSVKSSTSENDQRESYVNANRDKHDNIDAINQMFAEFELAYHNQYHKAYAQDRSVGIAKKYWLSCLASYGPTTILKATRRVVSEQEYLPSVATLIKACEDAMLSGLPSPHDAYVEACCATLPKTEYQWSHAVVYHAGKNTGWFELANQFETSIFPLFEYHYRLLCKRLANGINLDFEVPKALPEGGSMELSVAENKACLEKLRKLLDT